MQKFTGLIILSFLSMLLQAQAPHAFNYQAVARDASGNVLNEQEVTFRISILQGGVSGTSVYVETHAATTSQKGLVNLIIGGGTAVSGDMSSIDWGADEYYTHIEMDPFGGVAYIEMGTTQLLSVPFALHAATVEQQEFDTLSVDQLTVDHGLTIGNGLKIGQVYELTGRTDDEQNYLWMDLPAGMNAKNTRVLDLAIYLYVFMGAGVYYGLGSTEPTGSVGYWLGRQEGEETGNLRIEYPDEMKDKPFRITLMHVENSVVIE